MLFLRPILEIFIFTFLIFFLLRLLEGTKGEGIVKGTLIFFVMGFVFLFLITSTLQLPRVKFFLEGMGDIFFIATIIIFQPELRNGLTRLGRFGLIHRSDVKPEINEEIISALTHLSHDRVGALIAIENEISLRIWIEKGVVIDGVVTKELLCTIFWPGTNLHDGAVIINKYGILSAASCFFPPSDSTELDRALGTRHRAALGLSEETDALVLVVSEETGIISFAHKGKLKPVLNLGELSEEIEKTFTNHAMQQTDPTQKNKTILNLSKK
ncbi:MAG: diadenylate cyclase CdaA [Planctomycetota bacterium]